MNKDDILKIVKTLGPSDALHTMYAEMDKGYFMEESGAGMRERPESDEDDFKLTISPSMRNPVVGLVRLLTTNYPHFTAKSELNTGNITSKIEHFFDQMWNESCEAKRADVHTDAVRSAGLYGECHLRTDLLEDSILTADAEEKDILRDILTRTPALIEALSPREDWAVFGRRSLRGMLRRFTMSGDEIKSTWKAGKDQNLTDSQPYNIMDWMDVKDRMIWIEGRDNEALLPVTKHTLKNLLIVVQLADGSELWRKDEQQRQPFLYAMVKGRLWRRYTLLLSEMFTSVNERGSGPLVMFEEMPEEMQVVFKPGLRYIAGVKGGKLISESAYDPELVALMEHVLDPLAEASTIFPQTLGSAADVSNSTFSQTALLSQSGQLPTVPVKKAVTNAIEKLMLNTLRRFKDHPPENFKKVAGFLPSEIPDDLQLEVGLEIKLPQDVFRNSQVAQALEGKVSDRWIKENLLQISDPEGMQKEIWEDQAANAWYGLRMNDFLADAMAKIQQARAVTMGGGGAPGAAPGEVPPGGGQEVPPTAEIPTQQPPEGMMGAQPAGQGVQMPGGGMAGMAGGGAVEATGPVTAKGTRPPKRGAR